MVREELELFGDREDQDTEPSRYPTLPPREFMASGSGS
jgi:hypothetical protein